MPEKSSRADYGTAAVLRLGNTGSITAGPSLENTHSYCTRIGNTAGVRMSGKEGEAGFD